MSKPDSVKKSKKKGSKEAKPVDGSVKKPNKGEKYKRQKELREAKRAAVENGDAPAPPTSTDKLSKKERKELRKQAKKEAKKNKKEIKKEERDKKQASEIGADEQQKEEKSSKKKSKKNKKPASDDAKQEEQPSEGLPPSKKSKKVTASPYDTTLPTAMASVGDRTLASTRPKLVKALYTESSEVTSKPESEIEKWHQERQITLEHSGMRPIFNFEQSGLSADELYATRNFTSPSPIQAQCMPIVLSGRDVVGIAATGSGKTLAFGLPALRHIRAQIEAGVVSGKKPVALMLAPTRELALQISAVLEEAGSRCGISSLCVYGGVPKKDQAQALRRGNIQIIVATPGRLEDFMEEGSVKLDDVSYLVLDEADRMLDLGFEPHIRKIASATRADRQTLMFSATWPPAIRKLASEFLSSPARVVVGSEDLAAAHSVKQHVEVVDERTRNARLDELLKKYHSSRKNRIIVFVLYKKEASRVESMLQGKGWKAAAVHGDVTQAERTARVEAFKTGQVPLLVATDVAARGLDIPDVEVVINYSFPLTTEDYVHRIGRTGRAGKKGVAHTFFVAANDKPRAGELINVLREANQDVPESLLAFGTAVKKKESKMYGAHFKEINYDEKATKKTFDDSDDE